MTTDVQKKPSALAHPPLAEGQIAVRRSPIYLPDKYTSVTKFQPAYELPLYKALWKMRDSRKSDPSDPVRILDVFPVGSSWREAWFVIDADGLDDAMHAEAVRLNSQFGMHPSGERLFDVVYPGDAFEQAFMRVYKASTEGSAPRVSETSNPAIAELASLDGIGIGMAGKLYAKGIHSIRDFAMTPDDILIPIIGKGRLEKAKASADAVFSAPTPVEE